METINKLLKNTWIKWVVVPFMLLLMWAVLTLAYIVEFDSAFSVLSYPHYENIFTKVNNTKILKDNKISGEFEAKENNLGIAVLQFRTYQRVSYEDEDILIFRIKEKGSKKWYYEHPYKSGLFFEVPLYPFGFPKIPDSKNKTYVFELESTRGDNHNAVAISARKPNLISKYEENKQILLSSHEQLINFTAKKFINSFQLFDVQFFSFVYLVPFLFYMFSSSGIQKILKRNTLIYLDKKVAGMLKKKKSGYTKFMITTLRVIKVMFAYSYANFIFILLYILITLNIFQIQIKNDMIYPVIMGLWIATIKKYHLTSRLSLMIAFCLLFLSFLLSQVQLYKMAEMAASWAYLFLAVCLGQTLIEFNKTNKPVKTSKKPLKTL